MDENGIQAGAQKTLHQRNKSSPALSSTLHAGGLKAAAKRTAFGDVGNNFNFTRPSKDDSEIGAKRDGNPSEKQVSLQPDKKPTALLRPAQRPISVSGLKSLLNNVTNLNHQPVVKQPLPDMQPSVQAPAQAANVRKVLTKRNTTVFKDLSQTQPEQRVLELDLHKEPLSTAPIASAHPDLVGQQGTKGPGASDKPQPKVRQTKSTYTIGPEDRPTVPEPVEDNPAIRSDGAYIDDQGKIQIYQYSGKTDSAQGTSDAADKVVLALTDIKGPNDAAFNVLLDENFGAHQSETGRNARLTSVSEPEEYWDEDEEENYDEDGYVTARSYKSHGDNTTNGATTVLFPKMNQKVKRELATAKELIESTRTNAEIDDESWDTTMVAEYGEEIFQYMKELEVNGVCMMSMLS